MMDSLAFELDHAGVGSPDLAGLAAVYERLGFTLTPMARHRGKATANRCIMLRHGYLELIAPVDLAIADALHGQLARYAGLHILALGIHDSEATLARLRAAGLDIAGVAPLERPVDEADPAGAMARFERIPLPDAPEGTLQLIKHLTREAIWQERFMRHANNAVSLDSAVIAAPVPADTAARLSRLAGVPVVPDPAGGFALVLERGRIRILPPEAIGRVFPGVAAPAVPSIAGLTVATSDGCAALRPMLAGLAHSAVDAGILVHPDAAGGAALLFT